MGVSVSWIRDDATQTVDMDEEVEEVQGLSPEKGPRFGDQRAEEVSK